MILSNKSKGSFSLKEKEEQKTSKITKPYTKSDHQQNSVRLLVMVLVRFCHNWGFLPKGTTKLLKQSFFIWTPLKNSVKIQYTNWQMGLYLKCFIPGCNGCANLLYTCLISRYFTRNPETWISFSMKKIHLTFSTW